MSPTSLDKRLSGRLWIPIIAALTAIIVLATWYYYSIQKEVIWSMIHVSGDRFSGDAHLLEFPDGHVTLIDTGFDRFTRKDLIPYLKQRRINHIDQIVITHAHRNHYGGIESLMQHMQHIDRIYFNLPAQGPCERETWATGCNYQHVLKTRELIEQSPASLLDLAADQVLYRDQKRNVTLSVVFVHDGLSEPIGDTDINDTSAVLRLSYGNTSVLFTGDLNHWVGEYLVRKNYPLASTMMTAPHHGVEGAAPNEFLSRVKADVLMVSNSAGTWLGERGNRIREFAAVNSMRTYVTGLHGTVVVQLGPHNYTIDSTKAPEK